MTRTSFQKFYYSFSPGVYRTEPTTGTQYELYFKTKISKPSTNHQISSNQQQETSVVNAVAGQQITTVVHHTGGHTKVTLMRPFAPLQALGSVKLAGPKEKEMIHVILPLSGRISTFQVIIDRIFFCKLNFG